MSGARTCLAVGLGTATGSLCRYAVSLWVLAVAGSALPWATLCVNTLGSCLIGWLATKASQRPQTPWACLQPLLVPGFCAGFTTFSLFGLETVLLLRAHPGLAALYVLLSLALWLGGTWLGTRLARTGD